MWAESMETHEHLCFNMVTVSNPLPKSLEPILALAMIHLLTVRTEGASSFALCSLPLESHFLPISKPVLGKGNWVAARLKMLLRSPSGVYSHFLQFVISIPNILVCVV